MFDQKFGLLFYSPIYLCAVAGCWLMLRDRTSRYLGAVLLSTTARLRRQHDAALHVVGRHERAGAVSRAALAVPRTDDRGGH